MILYRYIIVFLCAFCWNTSLNAQVSVGVKYTVLKAGYGEKGKYKKEDLYVDGRHYALLFHINMGKYLSIGLEPGITKKDYDHIDNPSLLFIDLPISQMSKVNVIEMPIHLKVRVPIVKDRFAAYSKIGVRANYIGKNDQFSLRAIEKRSIKNILEEIDQDFTADDLVLNHLVGLGISFQFERSQFFFECEQYKKFNRDKFDISFEEDFSFKELQFGVGYLFTI